MDAPFFLCVFASIRLNRQPVMAARRLQSFVALIDGLGEVEPLVGGVVRVCLFAGSDIVLVEKALQQFR